MREDIPMPSLEIDFFEPANKEETLEPVEQDNFFLENDFVESDLFDSESNEIGVFDFLDNSEMLLYNCY